MNYQNAALPKDAKFAASTPVMNEKTVLKSILKGHMAPKEKYGYLKVLKGSLKFVWEDTHETFDADPGHPVVILPERYHHVELTGPVEFQVEFYETKCTLPADPDAVRPSEQFIKKQH